MVWWWVAGIILIGLGVLGYAVASLLGRLREASHAVRALRLQADRAQALQEPVLALRQRAESMQSQVLQIQEHLDARAARRADAG